MNIVEAHISNIIKNNNINHFDIIERQFESRLTPSLAVVNELLTTDLGKSICFYVESFLYWSNVGNSMDTQDWTNLHLPELFLIGDNNKSILKTAEFSWNWLGPICTPLHYNSLCNVKGIVTLNHFNPLNTSDNLFFLSYHKLFLINPKI